MQKKWNVALTTSGQYSYNYKGSCCVGLPIVHLFGSFLDIGFKKTHTNKFTNLTFEKNEQPNILKTMEVPVHP
jgi:hypothetical protein